MEIQIGSHTLERAEERGVNEDEIKDVILTSFFLFLRSKEDVKIVRRKLRNGCPNGLKGKVDRLTF
jgi:hypothetical protein